MKLVVEFFSHPLFSIVGGVFTIVAVIGLMLAIGCWVFDVTPIAIRFGRAIRNRSTAVFASTEGFATVREALCRSRIFKDKNIAHIGADNVEAGADHTLFIVDWDSFSNQIDAVFTLRRSANIPVVILAKPRAISDELMERIANHPSTIVVNFRGRLVNDILTLMVTTSYAR